MGPMAQMAFRHSDSDFRNHLSEAMHVTLDDGMPHRVYDISAAFPADEFEGKLPHDKVYIENFMLAPFHDEIVPVGLLVMWEEETDTIYVFSSFHQPMDDGSIGRALFGYKPKTRTISFDINRTAGRTEAEVEASEDFRGACAQASALDVLFMLMCEPRYVKQTPVSKLKRKMAGKKIGQPATKHTWVKLGWTIGSDVSARQDPGGTAPAKAFHMVRGHWRSYGDRQTAKAERREGRVGWWVWVDSHFSGNPALGEIKHHYQPKLDDDKSARVIRDVVMAKARKGQG